MSDKVVIITGASSGIGRATALVFARNGWSVIAAGRNEIELNRLRDDAFELQGQIKPHLVDVLEQTQVDRLINDAVEQFGRIDSLINAAGIIKSGTIETTSLGEWDKMLNINLRAVFYIIQRAIPHLEAVRGNIVNISSVTGKRAFPGVLAYCVSKAGLDQLTRCAALELAPKGVRVNAVNPGVVETNLHRRGGMSTYEYRNFLSNAAHTHPIGRHGQPEEVAELIYFLASEKAGWITGVTYEIDGGRSQTCAR